MGLSIPDPTYLEAVLADDPVGYWRGPVADGKMVDSSVGRVARSLIGAPVPIDLSGNWCGQPGMCVTDETIVVVYSNMPSQLGSTANLYISTSADEGDSWTDPRQIVTGFEGSDSVLGSCGLVTLGDGSILLTFGYFLGFGGGDYSNYSMRSTDVGATWSVPVVIPVTGFGYKGTLGCSNPTLLPDGSVLRTIYGADGAAAWTSGVGTSIRICKSTDEGASWSDIGAVISMGPEDQSLGSEVYSPNESTIVPTSDGRLMLVARVDAGFGVVSGGYLYTCYSSDGGETWTPLEPKISGAYAVPATVATPDGDIWVASRTHGPNAAAYATYPATPGFAVGSADDGETWGNVTPLTVLAPTTTVNGSGQVISGTPSVLDVESTAGFPATGQATVAGVTGTVSYTGKTANQLTGCTGSGTATNGGVVELLAYDNFNYGAMAYVGPPGQDGSLACVFGQATFPGSNGGLYFCAFSTKQPSVASLALTGSYTDDQPSPLTDDSTAVSISFSGAGYANAPMGPPSPTYPVPLVTNDALVALGLGSYSIEGWLYPADLLNDYWAFGLAYGSVLDPHVNFNEGTIETSGTSGTISYGGGSLPAGVWYHVVLVVNGNSTLLYVNGRLVAVADALLINPDGLLQFTVAEGVNGFANFKGNVTEVALYPRPLSPERVLAHYQAAVGGETPLLDNGLVRVRYDSTNARPGFVFDAWAGGQYVEQGKLMVYRHGGSPGYCDSWRAAGLPDDGWSPERAVAWATLSYSGDPASREQVFATLQRGWPGAVFEVYPAPLADGDGCDVDLVWEPALTSLAVDRVAAAMKSDTHSLPPAAGTGVLLDTGLPLGSVFPGASIGASSFASSENYVALLREPRVEGVVGPLQAMFTLLQAAVEALGESGAQAYGIADNAIVIATSANAGYLQVGVWFAPTQSDQVLDGPSWVNGSSSSAIVVADALAYGGSAVKETQASPVSATCGKTTNLLSATYRFFVRMRTDAGTTGSVDLGDGVSSTTTVTGVSSTPYENVDLGELTLPEAATLSLDVVRTGGSGGVYVDRMWSYLISDQARVGPSFAGARDLGRAHLYDQRVAVRRVKRGA